MGRYPSSVWGDADALHRLARAERRAAEQHGSAARRGGLPPAAFPPFPEDAGFRIHAAEAPRTLASGDYCEAFLLTPRTLAVVIADVCGKGVSAAVVRGVTRSVVRNISPVCESPADLLERLEQILVEAELGAMFVTLFAGWYHTTSGVLRYANAGHPRPYRVTPGGRVAPFGEVTGPILGIFGSGTASYAEREGRLAPGERLVLYTDGVTDARSPEGEFFGEGRFGAVLRACAAQSVERMSERVIESVGDFESHHRHDDLSLLVLERSPA